MRIVDNTETIKENYIYNPNGEDLYEIKDSRWSVFSGLKKHPTEEKISYNITYSIDIYFSDYFRYRFVIENLTFFELDNIKPNKMELVDRAKKLFITSHEMMSNDLIIKGFDISVSSQFPFTDEEILLMVSDLIEREFYNLS